MNSSYPLMTLKLIFKGMDVNFKAAQNLKFNKFSSKLQTANIYSSIVVVEGDL